MIEHLKFWMFSYYQKISLTGAMCMEKLREQERMISLFFLRGPNAEKAMVGSFLVWKSQRSNMRVVQVELNEHGK